MTVAVDKGSNSSMCAVCFEDFTLAEEVWKLPCEHMFHEPCIRQWIEAVRS